jgi:hypothetical protein
MFRIAHCSCGSLRVETTGEPTLVAACHCRDCQRRTGAPYSVSAYFKKAQVREEGASKVYIRDGQEGRKLRFCFCPSCGTSVYWEAEYLPDDIGVAVGTFTDPLFPAPTLSVWEEFRHPWVQFAHDLGQLSQQPPAAHPAGGSEE